MLPRINIYKKHGTNWLFVASTVLCQTPNEAMRKYAKVFKVKVWKLKAFHAKPKEPVQPKLEDTET